MTSLDELEAHLLKLDNDFADESRLKGVSFHKTQNKSLGFDGLQDFTVFIPWKKWEDNLAYTNDKLPKHASSALQEAFKDVLNRGKATDKCFIDIAELRDGNNIDFFVQGETTSSDEKLKSVGKAIADVIEALPDDNAKITIRFLMGDPWDVDFEGAKDFFHQVFWPKDKNGTNTRLISKKKNATLHVGYYSPVYNLRDNQNPLNVIRAHAGDIHKIANWLEGKIKKQIPPLHALADKIANASNDNIVQYLGDKIVALSWNHGKILAVNGNTLMTGGANYWWQNASNKYLTIEQQCKLEGDAAVSAHAWQDYFFRYLNKPHKTDTKSFQKCVNLNQDFPPKWAADSAPLSTDKPYEIKMKTTNDKYKVLTTSQLGDWHGKMADFDYPVQVVQAFKDLILNVVWSYFANDSWMPLGNVKEQLKNYHVPVQGVAVVLINALFAEQQVSRDHFSKVINHPLTNPYKTLRINPNAWASRITRLNAIANAKKSVILCQQRINLSPVNYEKWNHQQQINKRLGLQGDRAWNGYTWPYDLLVAFGYALARTKGQNAGSADIQIVLTAKHDDEKDRDGGWGDTMLINDLKDRLKMVMKGMAFLPFIGLMATADDGLAALQGSAKKLPLTGPEAAELKAATELFSKDVDLIPLAQVDQYVDDHVKIGRVLKGHIKDHDKGDEKGENGIDKHYIICNHSKIVCVDDQVMYVGSDNIYPSYNEEHGVWIDDENAIKAWKEKFWNELWTNRTMFKGEKGEQL